MEWILLVLLLGIVMLASVTESDTSHQEDRKNGVPLNQKTDGPRTQDEYHEQQEPLSLEEIGPPLRTQGPDFTLHVEIMPAEFSVLSDGWEVIKDIDYDTPEGEIRFTVKIKRFE